MIIEDEKTFVDKNLFIFSTETMMKVLIDTLYRRSVEKFESTRVDSFEERENMENNWIVIMSVCCKEMIEAWPGSIF